MGDRRIMDNITTTFEDLEHVYQESHPHQENNEPVTPINQNKNEHDEHEKKKKKRIYLE